MPPSAWAASPVFSPLSPPAPGPACKPGRGAGASGRPPPRVRAELAMDVLEHETRHVVAKNARVDSVGHRAQVLDVAALQLLDVVLDVPHLFEVESGVVLASLERRDHALGGRLRSPPRERRD